MDIAESKMVKRTVSSDLKERHFTQEMAGQRIGLTRQTVSNILSSEGYFTEKQAVLFSLAFGYDKNYLTTGHGKLLSGESQLVNTEAFKYCERLYSLYYSANEVYGIVTRLSLKYGVEKCEELLKESRKLYKLLSSMFGLKPTDNDAKLSYFPQVDTDGRVSYDINVIELAERLFYPLYNSIVKKCKEDFGVDME